MIMRLFDLVSSILDTYLEDTVSDDRRPIYHGDLVHELHLVLERRVEENRAEADHDQRRVAGNESEKKPNCSQMGTKNKHRLFYLFSKPCLKASRMPRIGGRKMPTLERVFQYSATKYET
jgi:hypothetical protein